jgi:ATP-binding cassette subfamily B protein
MAFLLLLLLLSIGLQLTQPQVISRFIDQATGEGEVSVLLSLAGLYLAVAVINQLLTVTLDYLGNDVAWRSTNRIRTHLFKHALRLDMRYHNLKTPGEMIERIDGDVTHMSNFFGMFLVQIVGSFVLLAGILGYMYVNSWPIAVALTTFTAVSIGVMFAIRNLGVKTTQEERQANASLFGLIEERIAGIEDVQANGGTQRLMIRYHDAMRAVFRIGRKAWLLRITPWNTTVFLFTLAVTAVLMIGMRLYMDNRITIGTLYLFFQYTQMLNDPIEQLGNQLQEFQKAKSGMRRSQELLSERGAIEEGNGESLPNGSLSVSFEHVNFGYGVDRRVLHDINFTLQPGERLGLVGRTGSGKTSISRLLLRLYDIDSGTIRIGGEDIRSLRIEALYRKVGMVTQDVQLFDGTLRDNLTLFNADIADEEVLQTTERLGLQRWLDAMPDGLDTRLTSGGTSLSAGQAQLFALTRVFLTRPNLIILDEPSSRLDAATEATLQTAVDQLLANCTSIIIAHRLSTLDNVDKIMVLSQGRVIEFGARAALAEDPDSAYSRLLGSALQEELA